MYVCINTTGVWYLIYLTINLNGIYPHIVRDGSRLVSKGVSVSRSHVLFHLRTRGTGRHASFHLQKRNINLDTSFDVGLYTLSFTVIFATDTCGVNTPLYGLGGLKTPKTPLDPLMHKYNTRKKVTYKIP